MAKLCLNIWALKLCLPFRRQNCVINIGWQNCVIIYGRQNCVYPLVGKTLLLILGGKPDFGLWAAKLCHDIGRQNCADLKRIGDKISVGKKILDGKTSGNRTVAASNRYTVIPPNSRNF